MTNKIKILFWFNKNSKGNQLRGAVWCRVTLNTQRIEIGSTGQLSTINDWNAENQRFKTSYPNHKQSNLILSTIQNDLMNLYFNFEAKKQKVTPNQLRSIYKGDLDLNPTFESICEKFFSERHDLVESSKVSYKNRIKNFVKFCKHSNITDIKVEDITPKILNRFYAYLSNNNFAKSTAGKAKQAIKTVLNWGCEHEYFAQNPLSDCIVKIDRKVNTEHLSVEEMHRIINYQFDSSLQQVADCFIFCCQTGLEFSGIEKLDFKKGLVNVSGRLCLKDERLKTGVERFVPLNEIAIKLIDKYSHLNKFPMKGNSKMNAELKLVAIMANIEKRLYWHIARKTFADHCLNEHGYSMEATMKAMGQSNLNSIKPYAKIDERRVLSEFANFQITIKNN